MKSPVMKNHTTPSSHVVGVQSRVAIMYHAFDARSVVTMEITPKLILDMRIFVRNMNETTAGTAIMRMIGRISMIGDTGSSPEMPEWVNRKRSETYVKKARKDADIYGLNVVVISVSPLRSHHSSFLAFFNYGIEKCPRKKSSKGHNISQNE